MIKRAHLISFAGAVLLWALPTVASAQYKNNSWGLDIGYWQMTKPGVLDDNGSFKARDNRPNRLFGGVRIGGETNFKLDADHWWFTGRVNMGLAFWTVSSANPESAAFDEAAKDAVGTVFGLEGQIGVKYFFLTDRFRPYTALGLSYLRLFSFSSTQGDTCSNAAICANGGSNIENFLPHPNVGGIHLTPGIEFIVERDLAINVFIDAQYWLVFNAPGNFVIAPGIGVVFYT